ncbi:MAG: rhamnan synthesis F family protein [Microgenomates group bacterium]
MIPGWKIRRELGRIVEQVRNIPAQLLEPYHRARYDRQRWTRITTRSGAQPQTAKVCLFLIYQPGALPPSIVATCAFLSRHGYCVIVVANGGLPPGAAGLLHDHVWQVLERPNLGYDFGGYQDGVKYLNRCGVVPDRLLILNDSIWFPLDCSTDVVQQLESSPHDLCGLMLHSPARNDEPSRDAREEGHRRQMAVRKKAEHIESYVFAVQRAIFLSDAFQSFWERYAWSSSKSLTIKRGEVGFSRHMARHGKTVGAISSRHLFVERLAGRDDGFLRKTLVYAAYSDPDLAAERQRLLAADQTAEWRAMALDHMACTVRRRRFNASFSWATEEMFHTSFVKKHPGRLFQLGRIRFVDAVARGDLVADNLPALAELRDRVAKDSLALDLETVQ